MTERVRTRRHGEKVAVINHYSPNPAYDEPKLGSQAASSWQNEELRYRRRTPTLKDENLGTIEDLDEISLEGYETDDTSRPPSDVPETASHIGSGHEHKTEPTSTFYTPGQPKSLFSVGDPGEALNFDPKDDFDPLSPDTADQDLEMDQDYVNALAFQLFKSLSQVIESSGELNVISNLLDRNLKTFADRVSMNATSPGHRKLRVLIQRHGRKVTLVHILSCLILYS